MLAPMIPLAPRLAQPHIYTGALPGSLSSATADPPRPSSDSEPLGRPSNAIVAWLAATMAIWHGTRISPGPPGRGTGTTPPLPSSLSAMGAALRPNSSPPSPTSNPTGRCKKWKISWRRPPLATSLPPPWWSLRSLKTRFWALEAGLKPGTSAKGSAKRAPPSPDVGRSGAVTTASIWSDRFCRISLSSLGANAALLGPRLATRCTLSTFDNGPFGLCTRSRNEREASVSRSRASGGVSSILATSRATFPAPTTTTSVAPSAAGPGNAPTLEE
mmetsp:Transcript_10915/g.33332  ORF Transcript_10915/g.33332 Transcript_10915/m.33332 type:complete len:273 (-) Transcript_10915:575-1393(-)